MIRIPSALCQVVPKRKSCETSGQQQKTNMLHSNINTEIENMQIRFFKPATAPAGDSTIHPNTDSIRQSSTLDVCTKSKFTFTNEKITWDMFSIIYKSSQRAIQTGFEFLYLKHGCFKHFKNDLLKSVDKDQPQTLLRQKEVPSTFPCNVGNKFCPTYKAQKPNHVVCR